MNHVDVQILYGIISFLDLFLLYILYFRYNRLSRFDFGYIVSILCSHFLLLLALSKKWYRVIDILHYFLFLSIVLSIFINDLLLQSIVLFLISLIQILWIWKERCIMNTSETGTFWGYSKFLTSMTLLFTILLSIKFGRRSVTL